MSKRRESLDRLSELPDSLVLSILSLLPMRDVVMTTLLSKRFKDLWTTVPCLTFKSDRSEIDADDYQEDEYGNDKYPNTRFQNFVNRALLLWRGTKILEFNVVIFYFEWPPFSDLDVWLHTAMENGVEKLNVNLMTDWEPDVYAAFTEYCPSQCFYSCSSIRELHLAGCKLKINGNVQWDQLKYLKIHGVSLSEHAMNQILSGSPQLEILSLSPVEVYTGLTIQSSSLKALKIDKFNYKRVRSVLTIWAPNLETLEILGNPYGKYVMKNVSSLTNATVDINFERVHFDDDGNEVQHDDDDNDDDGGGDMKILFEDIIGKAYETNRHVERVTLSDRCVKMFVEMKEEKLTFEPLSNANFLELYNCQLFELMDLLEIFPKLTKLVLQERRRNPRWSYQIRWGINDPSITKIATDDILESQTDFPKSCLLHLTTVEMQCSISNIPLSKYNDSICQFAEFFLKNAIKLEKLVLRATNIRSVKPESLLLISAKLLKIARASPAAEVILVQ